MNTRSHWLSAWSAVWLLATGIPEAFPGPRFLPASWTLIFGWLPSWLEWIWPGLFILTGIAAALGIRSSRAVVVGFNLSALAYLIWGCTSMYGWTTNQGGTIPGSAAYFQLFGFSAYIAYTVHRNSRIETQVADVYRSEAKASEDREDVADARAQASRDRHL